MPTPVIHDRQYPKWPPVDQGIMDKIHAPALGRAHRDRSRAAVQRDMLPSSHSHPQLEPIEPIQAANALVIDEPPLTSQQDPDPKVAKPRSGMCQIANAQS